MLHKALSSPIHNDGTYGVIDPQDLLHNHEHRKKNDAPLLSQDLPLHKDFRPATKIKRALTGHQHGNKSEAPMLHKALSSPIHNDGTYGVIDPQDLLHNHEHRKKNDAPLLSQDLPLHKDFRPAT